MWWEGSYAEKVFSNTTYWTVSVTISKKTTLSLLKAIGSMSLNMKFLFFEGVPNHVVNQRIRREGHPGGCLESRFIEMCFNLGFWEDWKKCTSRSFWKMNWAAERRSLALPMVSSSQYFSLNVSFINLLFRRRLCQYREGRGFSQQRRPTEHPPSLPQLHPGWQGRHCGRGHLQRGRGNQ